MNMRTPLAWTFCIILLLPATLQGADLFSGLSAYERGEYSRAYTQLEPLARQGHMVAQAALGALYYHGQGIPQDHEQAFAWNLRSARQGYAIAQYHTGYLYAMGQGTSADDRLASRWFERAARQNEPYAMAALAENFLQGRGVEQSDHEAFFWFEQAAELGHVTAQYRLGRMYDDGVGTGQNTEQALHWYRKAAAQGHPHAAALLSIYQSIPGHEVASVATEPAPPPVPVINLPSRAERVHSLQQASQRGDHDVAYAISSQLMREYPEDDNIRFHYGRASYATGRYPHALFAYERVLTRNPDAHRVRLEMGRAYLALNQPQRAREQFEEVLRHDPPPAVRANIEGMLRDMDGQPGVEPGNRLSGSVSLGAFHDSNVNSGLSSLFEWKGYRFEPQQDSDVDPMSRSDGGVMTTASLGYDIPLGTPGTWVATVGGQYHARMHFSEDDHNLGYLRLHGGAWRMGERSLWQMLLKYEDISYGGSTISTITGIEPLHIHLFSPRLSLTSALIVENRDMRDANRDSTYLALDESLRILHGPREDALSLGVRIFQEDATQKRYSYSAWEVRAIQDFRLSAITLSAGMSYRQLQYAEATLVLPEVTEEVKRKDTQMMFHLGVSRELTPAITLDGRVQYLENDSNIPLYRYEKTLITASLNYRF